jgi:hypothetical protein
MRGQYHVALKNLSNSVKHAPIRPHLTFAWKGFMVGSQIENLTPALFLNHNSCKSSLNDQCEGTLNIYASKTF